MSQRERGGPEERQEGGMDRRENVSQGGFGLCSKERAKKEEMVECSREKRVLCVAGKVLISVAKKEEMI